MNRNKFYNFISEPSASATSLYLYGAIVSDKWCEEDVSFIDFRDALDSMSLNGVLDIYINSPGGEVFVTDSIISMLTRAREVKNITINAYIDGLGASCASWLPMVADNVYVYDHSILMLHKPMTYAFGANSNDLQKEIELLDKLENVMIKTYMAKAKEGVTEDKIRDMLSAETWLDCNEIQEYFNVTYIEGAKRVACCVDKELFKTYANVPENLISNKEVEMENLEVDEIKNEEEIVDTIEEETQLIQEEHEVEEVVEVEDNIEEIQVEESEEDEVSNLKKEIADLTSQNEELTNKLNETSSKVIALNDQIGEMQVIVDKYNQYQSEKLEAENKAKLKEKKDFYKNKFEKLGARAKFESVEVQDLLNECISNNEALAKLNLMVVELVSVENTVKPNNKFEEISKVENLIDCNEDGASKYGFK